MMNPNFSHIQRQSYVWVGFAWLFVMAAVIFAYFPGLSGPFMLDDYGSIARLGDFNGVRDWETFEAFVFGGTSGPTGRPLSLLSFLIDANNWPTDPSPFKRTNLFIHLISGALIGVMILKLLEALQYEKLACYWIAFFASASWLLHPFLVSTTLYVVQRMAQLSTLFMLLGIITWLYGRLALVANKKRAYITMSLALPSFTFLAMFSKENGILLPILVGSIEVTVFAAARDRFGDLDKRWAAVFLGLPLVVVCAYLASKMLAPGFLEAVPPRDFSIYERLITEPRILFDYLQNWFIPKLYTTGVFQDHVIKSTSLFAPITTALAIAGILTLAITSWLFRKRQPLVALSVIFFLGNHLLESTVVNLELYFEHRNYLAVCLLFVPLLSALWCRVKLRTFVLVSIAVLAILAGFTRYSASVWASEAGIVEASAMKAPTSARAQTRYAMLLFNEGRHERGMQILDAAIDNVPGPNQLLLVSKLTAMCNLQTLDPAEFQRLSDVLSSQQYDARMLKPYNLFAKGVVQGRCPAISLESVLPLFTRMLNEPGNSDPTGISYTHIQFLIGYLRLYMGDKDGAMQSFEDSLASRPGASYAMAMAALLASNGLQIEALHISEIALTQLNTENNVTLVGMRASEADIKDFQATVRAELEARQGRSKSNPAE